jgi:hypothetical protein
MYILFAAALFPLAVVEGHSLAYFLFNPAMLEVRDSALEAPAVFTAVKFALYLLVPTAFLAIYVFVVGPREARVYAAILVVALCIWLYLAHIGGQLFAFNSWGRLYLESVPTLLLILLTVVFLVRRLR